MTIPTGLRSLPAYLALGAAGVLKGHKRSESVQLDKTYFTGHITVLEGLSDSAGLEHRIRTLRESFEQYNDLRIESEAITRDTLWDESERFLDVLDDLPETRYLRDKFPGECVVVPEWDPAPMGVRYGPRLYFFGEGDAPPPGEIIERNIDAVVNDDRERFERYQGHLHGYPECCIDFFHSRTPTAPPETRSVEPLQGYVADNALDADPRDATLDERFPDLLTDEAAYAFFAWEFYPEPKCDQARAMGQAIYDDLSKALPEELVKDYFRLNFGYSYVMAERLGQVGAKRPPPGALGREHLTFYLPLSGLLSLPRYR